ncbi:hypothetical protein ACQY0O_001744 [Thecaphora frezii]
MEVGTHCSEASCGRLSFLPITCPFCRSEYCESHFLPEQHACSAPGALTSTLSDTELAKRYARSAPNRGSSTTEHRLPCQKRGCKKFSLQVAGADTDMSTAAGTASNSRIVDGAGGSQALRGGGAAPAARPFAHEAPRCERCRGLYCMMHRSAIAHGCKAPPPMTEGQARIKAAEERKKKAAEVLAKHFPNRKT